MNVRSEIGYHSEEMGQSDLSRRIAHRDSGYPVLTILNPFLSLAGCLRMAEWSASRDLQCGVTLRSHKGVFLRTL